MTHPRLTTETTEDGDVLSIVFASQRSEMLAAIVHALVYAFSWVIFVPMLELFGTFDAMACFAVFAVIVFTVVTAIAVWAALRRKPPMIFRLSQTDLTFDSGITPVTYLMNRYRRAAGFYGRVFRGESSWTLHRSSAVLDPPTKHSNGYISFNSKLYRVDVSFPPEIEDSLRKSFAKWIATGTIDSGSTSIG